MPRFFFHFVCKSSWMTDDEGKELANLREAHRFAVLLIKQATCNFDEASDWRDWRIQIADVSDLPLLTVLFPSRSPGLAATIPTRLRSQY
jgi:hypothetical protein